MVYQNALTDIKSPLFLLPTAQIEKCEIGCLLVMFALLCMLCYSRYVCVVLLLHYKLPLGVNKDTLNLGQPILTIRVMLNSLDLFYPTKYFKGNFGEF